MCVIGKRIYGLSDVGSAIIALSFEAILRLEWMIRVGDGVEEAPLYVIRNESSHMLIVTKLID